MIARQRMMFLGAAALAIGAYFLMNISYSIVLGWLTELTGSSSKGLDIAVVAAVSLTGTGLFLMFRSKGVDRVIRNPDMIVVIIALAAVVGSFAIVSI